MAVNKIPRVQDDLSSTRTSARDKYSSLIVGRLGWEALLKYEAVVRVMDSLQKAGVQRVGLSVKQGS